MSLASLPQPAINLIFRFLSHPTADMIREARKERDVCCECQQPLRWRSDWSMPSLRSQCLVCYRDYVRRHNPDIAEM